MKFFDNDMDELFYKAGQEYPLNTDKKNWEEVSRKLSEDQPPATSVKTVKTINRYFRYLPALLLLSVPVVVLVFDAVSPRNDAKQKVQQHEATAVSQHPEPSAVSAEQPAKKLTDISVTREVDNRKSSIASAEQPATNNTDKSLGTGVNGSRKPSTASAEQPATNSTDKSLGTGVTGSRKPSTASAEKSASGSDDPRAASTHTGAAPTKVHRNNATEPKPSEPSATATNGSDRQTVNPAANYSPEQSPGGEIDPATFRLKLAYAKPLTPPGNTFQNIIARSYDQEQNQNQPTNAAKEKENTSFFYYGVKAGPDLSSIKGQKVEKPGYSGGLFAGFQFSRRFSVEASALWSRKKYYSDGEHFDKTRAYIPSSVEIYYVDGECNMIEVPIAIRYLFSPRQNSFFVTAGVNSYLMQSENYGYMADAGTGMYYGHRKYKQSGNHFFSNLQLSGGYQLKILRNTQMRLEPYLQIPISKVGIGRMPISSAGLHIGLFREIR